MTSHHLLIRLRDGPHRIRVLELELILRLLRRVPFLAVLRHHEAELARLIQDRHVRRIVEEVRVRRRAEEELSRLHRQLVEALARYRGCSSPC